MNLRMIESESIALPLGDTPSKKLNCQKEWGEQWDSNPWSPEPQSGALPTRPAWKAGILPLNYTRTLIAHPFFNAIRVYHKRPRRVKNFGPLFANFFHEIFSSRDRPLPFPYKTAFKRPAGPLYKNGPPLPRRTKGLRSYRKALRPRSCPGRDPTNKRTCSPIPPG